MPPISSLRLFRSPCVLLVAALLWAIGFTPLASAGVKLSNLETAPFGTAQVTAGNYKAQPFRTTASGPFEITTVTLRLGAGIAGTGQFFLAIYSGETAPVAPVPNGILTGNTNPLAAGNYTYTANGVTLDPGTPYWLVAGVSAGTSVYRWSFAATTTFQVSEWAFVEQFGTSFNGGASWMLQGAPSALPYQFSISNTAAGAIAFAGTDTFDDNDLGTIAPGNRWRFDTPLAGTSGTAFTNRNSALDFTAAAPNGNVSRFLGWITPSSAGGNFGFDWVATINVRNAAAPGAGFTLAGFEIYKLYSDTSGAVSNNAYYGVYLNNSAGIAATRVQAERGVWDNAAQNYVRSSTFSAIPTAGQRSGALRLQWNAASRTLVASYSGNGRDFTIVRTFALGGADIGRGAAWSNGFGLQVVGVSDRTPVAAGEITFDDMVVTSSVAPAVTAQPVALTVTAGEAATLTAEISGSRPLNYQWIKDNVAIAGATGPSLRLAAAALADAGAYRLSAANAAGSVTTATVALTVTTPLTITQQPTSTAVALGGSATFSVVSPQSALTFQWRRNGVNLPGKTTPVLTLNPTVAADYGTYTVLVTSPQGSLMSAPATLTLPGVAATLPTLTQQPLGVTINAGTTLVLNVAATGAPGPTYQWKANGITLPGATASTLVLANAQAADSGVYTVTATNAAGSVTSEAAVVSVGDGFSRQLNISTRGFAGTGADTLIPAFVISGANPKRLLIRAAGPALAAFGVGGTISDPQIAVVSNGTQLLTNDNWSADATNAAAVRAAATSVGAFPFADGSKDAAVVVTLPPGSGSILVTGVGGTTGEAIVEVYDLDAADSTRSRLVNLSTRAFVPATGSPLISGFVVQGLVAKAVLIRATGPALAGFGLPGTLAQPKLTIFNNDGVALATNTGWESSGIANAIITASTSVGAFPLTRGTADSVVLAVLPPGNYTAQIVGADGTGGVALVEVYELP